MANMLVWGKLRDLVDGVLPSGTSAEEVSDLSELRTRIDADRGSLVLADPARLERERRELEAWLKGGGVRRAVLVAVVPPEDGDDTLRRFPFLDDVLLRPVTPGRLRVRLERALEILHSRRVIKQLEEALTRKGEELHQVNTIGVALSAERDIDKLLELILFKSREITAADAGSLYLVERGKDEESQADDVLRFKLTQNDSVVTPFEELRMPLNESSIAGYVALSGEKVKLDDAYDPGHSYPFQISRSFDEKSGYRTKSMLVVPMRDHEDKVIGVIQLINKKRDPKIVLKPATLVEESVIPFTAVDEELVSSLTSQAAVAFENTRLIQDIKNLFDSFVRASVTAIEKRDPPTSGHSGRVAVLTVGLAEKVDSLTTGRFAALRFTADQLQEIRYASLLHDFGKVGVKENVLIKEKKLFRAELLLIEQRFAFIKKTLEAEHLGKKLDRVLSGGVSPERLLALDAEFEGRRREIDRLLAMIVQANEPTILEAQSVRALVELPLRTYPDVDGRPQPYLTRDEVEALSIRKGSLSDEERERIQEHVQHTYEFLRQIPWTSEYRRIPEIAYAHHEKLDSSGYPRGLPASQIPIQSRMMTISDIYDALVAEDRPYKRAVPVDKALDILREEVQDGKIDADLLQVFIEAKVYETTRARAGIAAPSAATSPVTRAQPPPPAPATRGPSTRSAAARRPPAAARSWKAGAARRSSRRPKSRR